MNKYRIVNKILAIISLVSLFLQSTYPVILAAEETGAGSGTSCTLSVDRPAVSQGEYVTFTLTAGFYGYSAYWGGSNNGQPIGGSYPLDSWSGDNSWQGTYRQDNLGTFSRFVEILNKEGEVICTTNTVTVNVTTSTSKPTVPSCESKKIADCVRRECDPGIQKMVCIDQWEEENCVVIDKPGVATDQRCAIPGGQGATAPTILSECFRQECDTSINQMVCINKWNICEPEGCTEIEKPGRLFGQSCVTSAPPAKTQPADTPTEPAPIITYPGEPICSLEAIPQTIQAGGEITWHIYADPPGISANWLGPDLSQLAKVEGYPDGNLPNWSSPYTYNQPASYTRQAVINYSSAPVCTTNSMTVTITPPSVGNAPVEPDINLDFQGITPPVTITSESQQLATINQDVAVTTDQTSPDLPPIADPSSQGQAEQAYVGAAFQRARENAEFLAEARTSEEGSQGNLAETIGSAASNAGNVGVGAAQAAAGAAGNLLSGIGQLFQPQNQKQAEEAIKKAEGIYVEPSISTGIPDYCSASDFSGTPETNPECYPQQRFERAKETAERAGFKIEGDPTNFGISITGAPDLSAYTVLNQAPASEEEKEASRKSAEALAKFVISLLPGGAYPELVEKSNQLAAETFVVEAICQQAGFVDNSYVRKLLAQTPKSGQKQRQEILELGKQVNPQFEQQIKETKALTYEELLARAKAQDSSLEGRLAEAKGLSQEEAKEKCSQETTVLETKIKDLNTEVAANTALELAGALPVAEGGVALAKRGAKLAKPVVRKITDPIGGLIKGAWDTTLGRIFRGAGKEIAQESAEKITKEIKPAAKPPAPATPVRTAEQALEQPDQPVFVGGVTRSTPARVAEREAAKEASKLKQLEKSIINKISKGELGTTDDEIRAALQAAQYPEDKLDEAVQRISQRKVEVKPETGPEATNQPAYAGYAQLTNQQLDEAAQLLASVFEAPNTPKESLGSFIKLYYRSHYRVDLPPEQLDYIATRALDIISQRAGQIPTAVGANLQRQAQVRSLPVVNSDPRIGKPYLSSFARENFKFLDLPEYQIILADGRSYTIADKYITEAGRIIVPIRKDDGSVFLAYLSTSEGSFKYYVGTTGRDRWFVKHPNGKDYEDLPFKLDEKLKELISNNQTHEAVLQKPVAEVIDSDFGLRHPSVAEGQKAISSLLDGQGVKGTHIGNNYSWLVVDINRPTHAVYNRVQNRLDVYFEGPYTEARYTFVLNPNEQPKVGIPDLSSKNPLFRQGQGVPIDFRFRPKNDPAAVFQEVPVLVKTEESLKAGGVQLESGWEYYAYQGLNSPIGRELSAMTNYFTTWPDADRMENLLRRFNIRLGMLNPLRNPIIIIGYTKSVRDNFSLIPTAYATEEQFSSELLDQKIYQSLVRQKEIKKKLMEEGEVDSDYVKAITARDPLEPKIKRTLSGYEFTTGPTGIVEDRIPEGKYMVEIAPVLGFDIKTPAVVEIKEATSTLIPVAIKKGTGKVEKTAPPTGWQWLLNKLFGTVFAQEKQDSPVQLVVFADTNNNGRIDKDEQVLPWAGLKVELKKVNQDRILSLIPGWNLVALEVLPQKPLNASTLLGEIAKQGGYATTVSVLENGAWKSFVVRGDKTYSGDDFPITLGKAYFVKALKSSVLVYQGQELVAPIKLKLAPGWNGVGIPYSEKPYHAADFIDTLNTKEAGADTASRWESGLWDTFVKQGQEAFGENFPIEQARGYLLKIGKGLEFSP